MIHGGVSIVGAPAMTQKATIAHVISSKKDTYFVGFQPSFSLGRIYIYIHIIYIYIIYIYHIYHIYIYHIYIYIIYRCIYIHMYMPFPVSDQKTVIEHSMKHGTTSHFRVVASMIGKS